MSKFAPQPFPRCVALGILLCVVATCPHAQTAAQSSAAPGSSFQTYAQSAAAARDAGRFDDALRDYQAALKIDPSWQEGWWNLGTLLYERDHYAEAIPAFQQLAELAPHASPAWIFLGFCQFETKDYSHALENLKEGQRLGGIDDPEIARVARYHLALLLIHDGQFDDPDSTLGSFAITGQNSPQIKFAMGLQLLRVPLFPEEVDPSRDALVQEAGEIATLMAREERAATLAAFQAAIKKYPDAPYLHYAYGELLSVRGDVDDAIAEFRKETQNSSKSAVAYIAMAYAELSVQDTSEALQAAQEAVRLAPYSQKAHEVLALCFRDAGAMSDWDREWDAAQKLFAEKPRLEDWIIDRYRAPSAARSTNGTDATSGDDLWAAAMKDYSERHYAEAIAELKIALQQKPEYGTGWAVLGLSEFNLQDYDNALIHLQRGQRLGMNASPESVAQAKYSLGFLLNRKGEFSAAEQELMSIAAPGPLTEQIRSVLGLSVLHIADNSGSLQAWQPGLVEGAGEIAALLRDSKYDAAFSRLDDLLKKYPSAPFLHYTYGTALASLSQFDEAAKQFRDELALSPSSELPYLGLASLELKRRRPADALEPAQHAVQLAPRSATAHYLLGRSYLETGKAAEAIAELQQASAITPSSPEIHFSLAKAYAKAGQPAKAEEQRATFAQLNTLAEQQRGQQGNQSYGAHDAGDAGISSVAVPADRPQ